jgi:phenylpropionate dioxygenase-like ring-hydroxylating dioxygenase large terminal subunit
MATRAPFLTQPYGAYYHRDIPQEDEELTHVGPGTPCGEYLRRFWQPVALSKGVQELPLRVRLLGEDLVVFRDQSGRVGCLELHCPHRGTSLEFGLIAERGIRCCYHGWLMDVDGRILDTPGEPADSTLKDRLWHGAYPTHEYQGMIFAYMGPPDKQPAFPILDTYNQPGGRMVPLIQHFYPCNWLQIQENVMDPAHLEFLHTITGSHFPEELRMHSVLDWMESPSGMICIATRRVDANIWVRINEYIPPNIRQFPAGGPSARQVHVYRARHTHFTVPVDDTTTMFMGFVRLAEGQEEPRGPGFGQTADRPYEERQRVPGDYDAQTSIHWGVSRHGLEHLATTDRGILMLRNIVRRGIRAVQNGQDPEHVLWEEGKVIPTYSNHTVKPVPRAPTPEAEAQLLRETGRQVAEGYLKDLSSLVEYVA